MAEDSLIPGVNSGKGLTRLPCYVHIEVTEALSQEVENSTDYKREVSWVECAILPGLEMADAEVQAVSCPRRQNSLTVTRDVTTALDRQELFSVLNSN